VEVTRSFLAILLLLLLLLLKSTNKLILEKSDPEKELMAHMTKLKLQYFVNSGELAVTVVEGSIEGNQHQGKARK